MVIMKDFCTHCWQRNGPKRQWYSLLIVHWQFFIIAWLHVVLKNGAFSFWTNWSHVITRIQMHFHILEHAGRKQIVSQFASRKINGLLLIFLRQSIHLLVSLWKSPSVVLSCKHLPLGLHSLFYHSNNRSDHSNLSLPSFFSFLIFLVPDPIVMNIVDMNGSMLIVFVVPFQTATFKPKFNTLELSLKSCYSRERNYGTNGS